MTQRHRPYTGNLPHAASLARSATEWMERELPMLATRLWEEDGSNAAVKDSVRLLREYHARQARALREIEDTLTTTEEEQDAAKEIHHAA